MQLQRSMIWKDGTQDRVTSVNSCRAPTVQIIRREAFGFDMDKPRKWDKR